MNADWSYRVNASAPFVVAAVLAVFSSVVAAHLRSSTERHYKSLREFAAPVEALITSDELRPSGIAMMTAFKLEVLQAWVIAAVPVLGLLLTLPEYRFNRGWAIGAVLVTLVNWSFALHLDRVVAISSYFDRRWCGLTRVTVAQVAVNLVVAVYLSFVVTPPAGDHGRDASAVEHRLELKEGARRPFPRP